MIEKQKSQVRKYLSESFQQTADVSSMLTVQSQGHHQPQGYNSHPGANTICTQANNYPNKYQDRNQNALYQAQSINQVQSQGYNQNHGMDQSQSHVMNQGHGMSQSQGHATNQGHTMNHNHTIHQTQNLNHNQNGFSQNHGMNHSQNMHRSQNMNHNQHNTNPVPLMAPTQYTGPSISPDAAMSPSLSSVATSTSEVSVIFKFHILITHNKLTNH